MVLTLRSVFASTPIALIALVALASGPAAAEDRAVHSGEVELPLAGYLDWVARADAADRARAERRDRSVKPALTVESQRLAIRFDDAGPSVEAVYELWVEGWPVTSAHLPFPGFAATAELTRDGKPSAGLALAKERDGGLSVVAREPGRYRLVVRGRGEVQRAAGSTRLLIEPSRAAVAVTEVDAPAALGTHVEGAVVVGERTAGDRRLLTLAPNRGATTVVEVRREQEAGEATTLLADSSLLTILQYLPDGVLRHDVVLFEVARGSLDRFEVTLPAGLEPELIGTDEGTVVGTREGNRLTVHRALRLEGSGYLVVTTRRGSATGVEDLAGIQPVLPVRARYLALAASIAVEARPEPAAAWSRVDLDDLPLPLAEALAVTDLVSAWRRAGEAEGARFVATVLPTSEPLPVTIRERTTTTLLTPDGTLLHRDALELGTLSGTAPALELELPPQAVIWSTQLDGEPIRPLDRAGRIAVPLGLARRSGSQVEIVYVVAQAVPRGRTELELTAARIAAPVELQQWRLLLPEGSKYRFREGTLRPVVEPRSRAGRRSGPPAISSAVPTGIRGAAEIRNRILDEEGNAIPGATVELLSSQLTLPIAQASDVNGFVRFHSLPSGTYTLRATLPGFNTVERTGVRLDGDRAVTVDLRLSLASVEETITVTAETPMIDSSSAETGQTFSADTFARSEREARRRDAPSAPDPGAEAGEKYQQEVQVLKQGLVSGVRPIPVVVPETGKALLLTALHPASEPRVLLETKPERR